MMIAGKTDIGKVRTSNQDAFVYNTLGSKGFFAIVCDGMGGHAGGNIASETAIEAFLSHINSQSEPIQKESERSSPTDESTKKEESSHSCEEIDKMLVSAIKSANEAVYLKAAADPDLKGMGTTVVAIFIHDCGTFVAHVGDSRAYLFDGKTLSRLTKDHSIVQEMIDCGELTEELAAFHPYKHVITRVLGVDKNVEVDILPLNLFENSKVLLCSDGLTNMISDEEINNILQTEENLEILCETLVNAANDRGGNDNITVVIAKI